MTNSENKLTTTDAIEASGSVLRLLSNLASLVVGFSAIAYIAGWREATVYYQAIGAPWVLSLLSASQIVQTSAALIALLASLSLASIFLLTQGAASQQGLRRGGIAFLVAAGLSSSVSWFLQPSHATLAMGATSIFWAISAGFTVGELVACHAIDGRKWSEYQVFLVSFIAIFGLIYAPFNKGNNRAELSVNPKSSVLPKAWVDAGDATEWRLVAPVGDKLLLMELASTKEGRRFKLVDPNTVREITASK